MLVRIATEIPCSFYTDKYKNRKKSKKPREVWDFIREVTNKGQGIVLNYVFQLPNEFTRNEFDLVFDNSWHTAADLRHLIFNE